MTIIETSFVWSSLKGNNGPSNFLVMPPKRSIEVIKIACLLCANEKSWRISMNLWSPQSPDYPTHQAKVPSTTKGDSSPTSRTKDWVAPGWLSWLSVWLRLRSRSHGSSVWAPHRAHCCQPVSTEPDMGLELASCEIMTWAEVRA